MATANLSTCMFTANPPINRKKMVEIEALKCENADQRQDIANLKDIAKYESLGVARRG